MSYTNKQRHSAARTDYYQRKVESEKLDGYGWTMSLDTVRTPEEILLVKQRFERLERQIDKLQPRIGRVLRLRLGINCKSYTLEEIAEQYGVTRERIRQMEAKAVRIVKRQVWIEEKPEEYLRGRAKVARLYKERIEAERAAAVAADAERRHVRAYGPSPEAAEAPEEAQKRVVQPPPRKPGILDEIVREQKRALALEQEYRGWAEGRERTLLPASALHGLPYAYKLRRVEPKAPKVKRDWLNVATEGFRDGA